MSRVGVQHSSCPLAACLLFGVTMASGAHAQSNPVILASYGKTLYRFSPSGSVESFTGDWGRIVAMTVVPPGMRTSKYGPGDVIAMQNNGNPDQVWIVRNPWSGTPSTEVIGSIANDVDHSDMAFAHGSLYTISTSVLFHIDPTTFQLIDSQDLNQGGSPTCGGIAFDRSSRWYLTNSRGNHLVGLDDPPSNWTNLDGPSGLGVAYGNSDLEWSRGKLWGALALSDGITLAVGTFDTTPGSATFNQLWSQSVVDNGSVVGLAIQPSACEYANCDGSTGSPALSASDFVCFLSKFRAADSYANCDGSTGSPALTAADFVCFLSAFRAGCP